MHYRFDWEVLWEYRRALLHGFLVTLGLSLLGLAGAICVGSSRLPTLTARTGRFGVSE